MSMTNDDTDEGLDYQVGAHSVDTEGIQFGEESSDDDFIEFELESRTVFKRLAEDIYKSDEAGVREPLTNAVTAVRKAVENYDLDPDEAAVHIQFQKSPTGNQLIIRDNGIGITEQKLQKVVAVIGRSTVRDRGDMAGQFGMGFLAVFRLVGTDGGFVMHTHSRKDGAEPISGVWKSGGFARDTEGELPGRMGDDEYGTKFEFMLNDDIDPDDVREWVEKYAEWARCPVIYQEFEDQSQVFNEDYGRKQFTDDYDEPGLSVTVENEFFEATAAEDADGKTILLDVPIERNAEKTIRKPWKVDIRFKNENSVVVDGPHEGLMPVADAEYTEMPPERQQYYVSEDDLTNDDVVMPGPTGTRDSLAEDEAFWVWLKDRLQTAYAEKARRIYAEVDTFDDLFNLSIEDYKFACHAVGYLFEGSSDPVRDRIQEYTGRTYNHKFCERDSHLTDSVEHAPRGKRGIDKKSNRDKVNVAEVLERTRVGDADGDVFMGVKLNQQKCKVVWEDADDNEVVHVEGTEDYEVYETLYGWKRLRDVRGSTIDEFDISDDLRQQFQTDDGKTRSASLPAEERELTIHFGRRNHSCKKNRVETIRKKFEQAAEADRRPSFGRKNPETLILFPPHKDENVSDYYPLANGHVGVATCQKSVWEYLKDTPGIMTLDQYKERAQQTEFTTNEGTRTIGDIDEAKQLVFHCLSEDVVGRFRQQGIMDEMVHYIRTVVDDDSKPKYENPVYAPVTPETLRILHPETRGVTVLFGDTTEKVRANSERIGNDTKPYLWARLKDWRDTSEFETIYGNLSRTSLKGGGYELVETFGLLHDAGVDPFSERVDIQSHLERFQSSE